MSKRGLYAATRLLHALGSDRMAPAVAARTSPRGAPGGRGAWGVRGGVLYARCVCVLFAPLAGAGCGCARRA